VGYKTAVAVPASSRGSDGLIEDGLTGEELAVADTKMFVKGHDCTFPAALAKVNERKEAVWEETP